MQSNLKRTLQKASLALFFIAILGYAAYQSRGIIAGPEIIIETPSDGFSTSEKMIEVSGKVLRADTISLNDRAIFVDLEGNFSERLLLLPGYNILSVKASDREGREVIETREIIQKDQ